MVLATKPKAKKPAKTKVTALTVSLVLDETGSMDVCRDATIGGFNEYIDELSKRKERIRFTLTKFNSTKIEMVCDGLAVKDVARLNRDTYVPAAMTPLYDAIAQTIRATEQSAKGDSVLLVVMTDGEENASHEYNRDRLLKLIQKKEKAGWTFVYLGANQDAWAVGQSIGVPGGNTMTYAATPDGVPMAAAALAGSTVRFAAAGASQSRTFFKQSKSRAKRA